jgi:hypothetical protein
VEHLAPADDFVDFRSIARLGAKRPRSGAFMGIRMTKSPEAHPTVVKITDRRTAPAREVGFGPRRKLPP